MIFRKSTNQGNNEKKIQTISESLKEKQKNEKRRFKIMIKINQNFF